MKQILFAVLMAMACGTGCAHQFGMRYPAERWIADDDARPIEAPAKPVPFLPPNDSSPAYLQDVEMLIELTARVAEVPSNALPGGRVEALNVNNFDEAPDSTWFTNRIGRRIPTDAELVAGPGEVHLKNSPPFSIMAMGHGIVVDWMIVRTADGDVYLLTFDRAERPEMATAAGFIVSRILFAAGYHVPPCSLVELDARKFSLAPTATFRDISGDMKPAAADLENFLSGLARAKPGGPLRAFATARPAGVFLGPFSYKGRRRHDENDRIAHQYRRELRGLDALAGWVDWRLAIENYTADFFVAGPDGRGHVVHYLMGFESSLGNFDVEMKALEVPLHPSAKLKPVSLGLPSVTLYTRRTMDESQGPPPSFDAEHLNPAKWEPRIPNPAMWVATERDELWGAILLSKFTDARLASLVGAAQFSSAQTRSQLLTTLQERRDKIMGFWFGRINPIGNFSIQEAADGARVSFSDFAADAHLPGTQGSRYRWRLRTANGRVTLAGWDMASEPSILIGTELLARMGGKKNLFALQVQTQRPDDRWPTASVEVLLKRDASGTIAPQGIIRRTHN